MIKINYVINDIEVEVEVDDIQWSNDSIGGYEYAGAHGNHQVEDHVSDFNIRSKRIIGPIDNDQENIQILVNLDNYVFHSDDDFIRKIENLSYDY